MSYRSFTRVLGGDTNLERKCRLLFGVSLLLLILGAFWFVEVLTRGYIKETTRSTAQSYVGLILGAGHFSTLQQTSPGADALSRKGSRESTDEFYDATKRADYFTEILMLSDESSISRIFADKWRGENKRVCDGTERKIVEELYSQQKQQAAEMQQQRDLERAVTADAPMDPRPVDDTVNATGLAWLEQLDVEVKPRYSLDARPRLGTYVYYQPVYWKAGCFDCHEHRRMEDGSQEWYPRVVKVVMPAEETDARIANVRALLLTVAGVTVFLAMIALYVVVRYVIVKPLKHLRDISEEVRRGNTALRADLQTNDEFQDLGDSFNRMLRHLVDAQAELRETNRQLDGRLDELAQANMQLFEMNRLKSDFLANMSHELRTPLNSIIGFADILQGADSLDARYRRYATNIGRSGHVLLDIINDILDLAKIESGRMESRPTEFSVEALIDENCDMVRSLSEEKNIDLEVLVPPGLPVLYQDQGKVQQILTNLLSNAIKFTPEGGRISVSAARNSSDQLVLVVADTGIGISEEDRQVIFEKFRQGSAVLGRDNLTREYSGTGLGLSIVKELCRLLDGEITFQSEVGKGTEFTVTLPWRRPESAPRRPETHDEQLEPDLYEAETDRAP